VEDDDDEDEGSRVEEEEEDNGAYGGVALIMKGLGIEDEDILLTFYM
jgi:hypothetical protein